MDQQKRSAEEDSASAAKIEALNRTKQAKLLKYSHGFGDPVVTVEGIFFESALQWYMVKFDGNKCWPLQNCEVAPALEPEIIEERAPWTNRTGPKS